MQPDDELCLCFHVTRRKVEAHLRHWRPQRASQLSECFGAGTGCGWCRPYLRRLFEAWRAAQEDSTAEGSTNGPDGGGTIGPLESVALPDRSSYEAGRGRYIEQGGGKPPANWKPRSPAEHPPDLASDDPTDSP